MGARGVYIPVAGVPGEPGKYYNAEGYILVRTRPGHYALEHVLIARETLGRALNPTECVHHINGLKFDNRRANLLICEKDYHLELHRRCKRKYHQWHLPVPGINSVQKLCEEVVAAGVPINVLKSSERKEELKVEVPATHESVADVLRSWLNFADE